MHKSAIRTQSLLARKSLSAEQHFTWSRAIHTHLAHFPPFAAAQCVLTCLDSKHKEVETSPIITDLLKQQKYVLVPRCLKHGILEWCRISSLDDLALNSLGIYESAAALPAQIPPKDSVCLVPGIAFRRDGHRIGYGGGYFDRFLADYQGISIGLAFEMQIRDDWEPSPHDIPAKHIVTEHGIIRC